MCDSVVICKEKLDASQGSKGETSIGIIIKTNISTHNRNYERGLFIELDLPKL